MLKKKKKRKKERRRKKKLPVFQTCSESCLERCYPLIYRFVGSDSDRRLYFDFREKGKQADLMRGEVNNGDDDHDDDNNIIRRIRRCRGGGGCCDR